jgi:transposase
MGGSSGDRLLYQLFTTLAKQDSTCRRIRNFLSKFTFDPADIAHALVEICKLKGSLHLAIDRTNWKFGCIDINLLVLAVVVSEQFSIPLFWRALPKKGNSNAAERIDIIQLFIKTFGVERIGSLMADREFIGKVWIDFLVRKKIPFFIRVKENRLVEWGRIHRHLGVFFRHLKVGEKRHTQHRLDGHLLYFAGTRSKDGELVIVVSNQDVRFKILDIYKKRWTIELMFRHCKSNGFNLEDTHLKDLKRFESLFAVVVSALALVFLVGQKEESSCQTPYKKSIKSPALSTFRRGFDYLRKLLIQAKNEAFSLLSLLLQPLIFFDAQPTSQKIVR